MKRITTFGLLLWIGYVGHAQPQQLAYDADQAFLHARDLAFGGKHAEARDTLKRILTDYPDYADVETLLAKTYSWQGEYDMARLHLNRVTSRQRKAEDAWVASVRNEIYAGNPSLALGLSNKALLYLENNAEIQRLRNEILAEHARAGADPESEDELRNFIALDNSYEVFDQAFDPMVYSSLEYTRQTRFGKVIPRLNYSNRFQIQGLQYELDLFPRINKMFYAYLNYGFSEASIYPNHRAGAELYANLPGALETSLGVRHLDFRESQATLVTGSFGIYRGNYYMSLRPYLSLFKDRSPGISGSALVRRYLKDAQTYLGIRAVYGFSPELRQLRAGTELLAETLLFVETQQLQLEYQFTAGNSSRYRAQLGVSHQEFLLEPGSFYWVFQGGLRYQLGF